jgi:hypothetical protein
MTQRLKLLLLLGLLACPVLAQPGPGLFGDRRWRAPIANAAALPVSGTLGEVRLTLDDGALYFWDGDSWEAAGSGGGSGEANTASNLGGGLGVYSVKVGVDLRFNSLDSADFDLTGNVVSIDDTKWAKDSELPSGDAPHSRTVTVDAGGLGDYETIGAALAHVATQTRSESTQWLVLVFPGEAQPASGWDNWYNYSEAGAVTVPSFTTLQGVSSPHNVPVESVGSPILRLMTPAGTAISLSQGSSLVNFEIIYAGTPSAAVTLIATDGGGGSSVLENLSIKTVPLLDGVPSASAFPITAIANSAGGLYLYETSVAFELVSAASVAILNSSTTGTSVYGGRFFGASPCVDLMRSTAGPLKLYWSRIDGGGCTNDLAQAGSGTVQVIGTPYSVATGEIIHADGTQGTLFCKTYSGTGSPEGVLSAAVCSSYWRRDGGSFSALYLKESGSGNTGWAAVGTSAQALAANGANCSAGNVALGVDAAGAAECAADDDAPEAGDFGALALTGPITSSGLATSIAADAVTLGSQTAGAYVASATASQGLVLTGSEAATLGLMDCAASEILKRNVGDTAWECAADASGSGSGGIGGTVGATSDAIPVADGTGGSTLKASTVKVTSGAVIIPDGSAAAAGMRFASFAAGTGLYADGSATLVYAMGGVARWSFSNTSITSQNGGAFRNAGAGEAVFAPVSNYGLGASSSTAATMYVAGFPAQEWTRPTGGVYRSAVLGQAVDLPQAVTCTDNGGGTAAALTVNPTGAAVYITNSDANGCVVTLGETNVTTGLRVELVVVSSAGGTVDFADTSGVTELAGAFAAGLYDSLALRYISDRWIETGRSDN